MKYLLEKQVKNKATIVVGFPGIGLVSTIATKFLLDHLKVEKVGYFDIEEIIPLTAIHQSKIVEPVSIYYDKKFNLVIIQALTEVRGLEWRIAKVLDKFCKDIKAKEIIVLESSLAHQENASNTFYYSNRKDCRFKNLKPMQDAIIMGVTAALLLKAKVPVSCLFTEAHSSMPDSEAAAQVVTALSRHMGMGMDTKPLLEAAKKFEKSLKHYIEKSKGIKLDKEEEKQSYFG